MQRVRELNRIISVHIKLDQLRYDCDMIWCGIRNVLYDTQSTSRQVKSSQGQVKSSNRWIIQRQNMTTRRDNTRQDID